MELILKKDVDNLGFKDDIVRVKNGYGRNFLIPSGRAILATEPAKKVLADVLKQRAFKEQKIVNSAKELADSLKVLDVKISAKTGEGTKLFGSVSNADVVYAIEKLGHTIDRKFVKLAGGHIKRLGRYIATIRLHREVVIELPFEVVKE